MPSVQPSRIAGHRSSRRLQRVWGNPAVMLHKCPMTVPRARAARAQVRLDGSAFVAPQIRALFREINKAEPIGEIDLPMDADVSTRGPS